MFFKEPAGFRKGLEIPESSGRNLNPLLGRCSVIVFFLYFKEGQPRVHIYSCAYLLPHQPSALVGDEHVKTGSIVIQSIILAFAYSACLEHPVAAGKCIIQNSIKHAP